MKVGSEQGHSHGRTAPGPSFMTRLQEETVRCNRPRAQVMDAQPKMHRKRRDSAQKQAPGVSKRPRNTRLSGRDEHGRGDSSERRSAALLQQAFSSPRTSEVAKGATLASGKAKVATSGGPERVTCIMCGSTVVLLDESQTSPGSHESLHSTLFTHFTEECLLLVRPAQEHDEGCGRRTPPLPDSSSQGASSDQGIVMAERPAKGKDPGSSTRSSAFAQTRAEGSAIDAAGADAGRAFSLLAPSPEQVSLFSFISAGSRQSCPCLR